MEIELEEKMVNDMETGFVGVIYLMGVTRE